MKKGTKSIREKRTKILLKQDFINKKLKIEYRRQSFLKLNTKNLNPNNEFD